jgi:DNA-directed RNA polymerase subunit E'/Rpb7
VLERRGAAVCLASLARERLLGDPDADMQGEVTGLIGGGLFVRFAGAFDGFLPSRWLAREHLEVNALGSALVGLDGRRWRLGDQVRVRLERVDVPRGRVTLVGRG